MCKASAIALPEFVLANDAPECHDSLGDHFMA
jgi:hypothetical protein